MHFDNTKEEAIFRIQGRADDGGIASQKPPKFGERRSSKPDGRSEQDMKTIQIAWQAVLAVELSNIKGYRTFSHHENAVSFSTS